MTNKQKPLDKTKLDTRTKLFIEFFESQGATFVDVTDKSEIVKKKPNK